MGNFTPNSDAFGGKFSGVSSMSQGGLVGLSVIVLAVGLLIAFKKKY